MSPIPPSLRSRASPRITPRTKPLVPGASIVDHLALSRVDHGDRSVIAILEVEVAALHLRLAGSTIDAPSPVQPGRRERSEAR